MKRIMTSSWSLHRLLGEVMYDWSDVRAEPKLARGGEGALNLLELPQNLAARDIGMVELCHFHLPSLASAYLDELRGELDRCDVDLYSVLIDAGDVAHPDPAVRAEQVDWVRSWLEIAARLGARYARVIAGDALPSEECALQDDNTVRASADSLRALAQYAAELNLYVSTENFRALGCHVGALCAILDMCEGQVGLCADFGNFKGSGKYDDLAAILPRATSVHAKADFSGPGAMDREDFDRCLGLAVDAGFAGPYSLIFSSPGDEWEGLAHTRAAVESYIAE